MVLERTGKLTIIEFVNWQCCILRLRVDFALVVGRLSGHSAQSDGQQIRFPPFRGLLPYWVFRTNVTADFGIVTEVFGPS